MRSRLLRLAAFALLAACAPAAPPAAGASSAMIGVLEDRPGATTAEPQRFIVRAAFHRAADRWLAYDLLCGDEVCLAAATARLPQQTTWTVSLNGNRLGDVVAHTPPIWTRYGDVGAQDVSADTPAPASGARSTEFAEDGATPVHRPLVASAPASFADPQSWAAAPAPAETLQALRRSFRAQFSDVANCAAPTAPPTARAYRDSDIDVSQTYASAPGWQIATLHLTGYSCDGPIEGAYADQVYAVSPNGEVRHLGEGLRYLDAGDYDNDGRSELIFAINRYNQGGYALFANDFAQTAEAAFSYH
jgi:hypothetical protein